MRVKDVNVNWTKVILDGFYHVWCIIFAILVMIIVPLFLLGVDRLDLGCVHIAVEFTHCACLLPILFGLMSSDSVDKWILWQCRVLSMDAQRIVRRVFRRSCTFAICVVMVMFFITGRVINAYNPNLCSQPITISALLLACLSAWLGISYATMMPKSKESNELKNDEDMGDDENDL